MGLFHSPGWRRGFLEKALMYECWLCMRILIIPLVQNGSHDVPLCAVQWDTNLGHRCHQCAMIRCKLCQCTVIDFLFNI